jgi:hypothetical protein
VVAIALGLGTRTFLTFAASGVDLFAVTVALGLETRTFLAFTTLGLSGVEKLEDDDDDGEFRTTGLLIALVFLGTFFVSAIFLL